eukprot:GHVP01056351.1.p1 GENE.GHVP01056351.1~~GHVP01056351.1.p1  ORF type:complete len:249 (-),score=41.58 GHVP01056351.1:97-843(-)
MLQAGVPCPGCKGLVCLRFDVNPSLYGNPNTFIEFMKSLEKEIKKSESLKITPESDYLAIIDKESTISFDRYDITLAELLVLNSVGVLQGENIVISDLSIEEIEGLLSTEEPNKELNSLLNRKMNIEANITKECTIKNPTIVPYLPEIDFREIEKMIFDMDIDSETAQEVKTINIGYIEDLSLFKSSIYLLPKLNIVEKNVKEALEIDTEDSDIDFEVIGKMNNACEEGSHSRYGFHFGMFVSTNKPI